MARYYKLTDEYGRTHGGTQWGPGVTHRAEGKGQEFCTKDFIHVYDDPLLAVLLSAVHANFRQLRLWRCRVRDVDSDRGLKFGVKVCTTVEEIPVPQITTEQKVRFGILCALKVCHKARWVQWAHNWLSGRDRSASAAKVVVGEVEWAAAWAAWAAWAARAATEWTALWAAKAAEEAARQTQLDLRGIAREAIKE